MLSEPLLPIFLCFGVVIFSVAALAAGNSYDYDTTSKMPPSYVKAVNLIESGKFQEAISSLKLADRKKPKHADIKNLFGFAYRKIGELGKAGAYYREALEIDGKHKGALEYQGELFLMVGKKGAAEENLRKLEKICWLGCSELDDLQVAIKNHKS